MQTLTFWVSLCSKGSHCWIVRNKNKNVHKLVLMISFTFLRNTWIRPLFTSEIDGHGLSSRYGKTFLKVVWAGKKKLHMVCSFWRGFSSRIKAWGLCYHVSWEWQDSLQMSARLHVMDPELSLSPVSLLNRLQHFLVYIWAETLCLLYTTHWTRQWVIFPYSKVQIWIIAQRQHIMDIGPSTWRAGFQP